MQSVCRAFVIVFIYCLSLQFLHAQASAAAARQSSIQLGVGWGFANPDFGQRKIQGLSVYGDYNITRHWSVEGDIHLNHIITPTDIGEDSYLLGPRYVFPVSRFEPYAKFLGGFGRFKTDYDNRPNVTFTYGMYAFGAGLDIRATSHVYVRAVDFEYQRWPGFRDNGLTPLVWTFGAAYRF
jgi:outer membrane protein with beta-barrel domain